MNNKVLLLILSLLAITTLAIFTVVLIPKNALQNKEMEEVPEKLSKPPVSFIDPIRGNVKADITIIEYGDFECALCKTLEAELSAVIEDAPSKRRLVWKDAPNEGAHPNSFIASMSARCAQDQGKFWYMHDEMLSIGFNANASNIRNLAQELGLNMDTFDKCMSSEVTRPVVQHTLDEAVALGIESTPTIYINNVEYTGPLTREGIILVIEAL